MLLKIYPQNPSSRQIDKVVKCLQDGGIIIYPTDTIYAIGCDLYNIKAINRVTLIKGIKSEKTEFSIICSDLSSLSNYINPISTALFRIMKKVLPGPFTFILKANNQVPKIFQRNKKTIGIRIPNNNICLEIVRKLGNPIISTSVRDEDKIVEYTTDPELIYQRYKHLVDIVIDGGIGNNVPSTIIDCTDDQHTIIRQGSGYLEF